MTNDDRFSGRVALVTGAASGIGAAAAERLLAEGARVATLRPAAGRDRGRARARRATSRAREDVDGGVARATAELGPIDVLVCSAGIPGASLRTADVSDEEWKRVLAINTDGVFWCNRAVAPGMAERGYGRIVNVASIAGKEGNPMAAAYSASKAAVIALTKAVGKDFAADGRRRQLHRPGRDRDADPRRPLAGARRLHGRAHPDGPDGHADEVAALICWLASEECSFSTGATYDISGGRATF